MDFSPFDQRPLVVAIAGPNGAGKTTFFHAHLASAGLRFVNPDVLAAELQLPPYEAAGAADGAELMLNYGGRRRWTLSESHAPSPYPRGEIIKVWRIDKSQVRHP